MPFNPVVVLIPIIVAARAHRSIRRLRRAGALSPDTARTLAELDLDRDRFFQSWERRAVLRATPDGRWYLDSVVHAAWRRSNLRTVLVIVAIVLAVLTVVVLVCKNL